MFGSGKHRPAGQVAPLGAALVALRLRGGVALPPGCVELVFSAAGQARRAPHSRAGSGEVAYAYHPGPYETVFAPFDAAPEIGLRLRYVADAADPRVAQQRFDLFLFSEAGDALSVEALHGAIAAAVAGALAQGVLELPACTTLDEWHGFRAGLNELLYTRFGLTVDDCVPVDLGESVDYAARLRARAAAEEGAALAHREPAGGAAGAPVQAGGGAGEAACAIGDRATANPASAAPPPAASPAGAHAGPLAPGRQPPGGSSAGGAGQARPRPGDAAPGATAADSAARLAPSFAGAGETTPRAGTPGATRLFPNAAPADPAAADAHALRRLFLELPAWSAAVRALALPSGQALFSARTELLQRCALAALDVNTMPSLAWAAPGRPLAAGAQALRAGHSMAAVQALDQAWALLARWRLAALDGAAHSDAGAGAEAAAVHAALLDEADRLTANLAFHLAARRAVPDPPAPVDQRKEPHL